MSAPSALIRSRMCAASATESGNPSGLGWAAIIFQRFGTANTHTAERTSTPALSVSDALLNLFTSADQVRTECYEMSTLTGVITVLRAVGSHVFI